MSISIAMVALGKGAKISANGVKRDLESTWFDLPLIGAVDKKDNTFGMHVGDADIIVGHMPAPIPWGDLEGPCATSWIWPDAAKVLKQHRSHLIVTVTGEDDPVARSRLLTQAVAAIIAAGEGVAGVYWCDARIVISPEVFRDFAVDVLPGGPPVHIWIDFRVGKNDQGGTSGFTTGMSALGHMEIETENASEPPGELRERLIALTGYLLENGPIIADGNTVGSDENEKIQVVYSPSAFGHPDQVMRLDYQAAGKKRWWSRG